MKTRVPAPTQPQLQALLDTLSHRIGRYLERHGWLVRDEDSYLQLNEADSLLHAGVWAGANDRKKLEHLCRYIARPAVSNERIELTECGHVRYTLKTPYRDGTTHVYFSPLDFMARLAVVIDG